MGKPKPKPPDIGQKVMDAAARCQQDSTKRRKNSYWTVRQSDLRIIQANNTINSARKMLTAAGKSPRKPKRDPDPDLVWDDLLIRGTKNPKRRADD